MHFQLFYFRCCCYYYYYCSTFNVAIKRKLHFLSKVLSRYSSEACMLFYFLFEYSLQTEKLTMKNALILVSFSIQIHKQRERAKSIHKTLTHRHNKHVQKLREIKSNIIPRIHYRKL